jgi:hypothetical protein
MKSRKSIPTNIVRQLWSQCGGYCQNPSCHRPLFEEVGDDLVSIANVAHVIGHGVDGPRSKHELAEIIDRDGYGNLLMLCLLCHKIVDELEAKFSVDKMLEWKANHSSKIHSLFVIPRMTEQQILQEVNDLLTQNRLIFVECGPHSENALNGDSGDCVVVWRRRCLDLILPNNERIIKIIEANKRHFGYPWLLYREMLNFRLHSDSFRDNCLLNKKINDYKLFPLEFERYVRGKLGENVEDIAPAPAGRA